MFPVSCLVISGQGHPDHTCDEMKALPCAVFRDLFASQRL